MSPDLRRALLPAVLLIVAILAACSGNVTAPADAGRTPRFDQVQSDSLGDSLKRGGFSLPHG